MSAFANNLQELLTNLHSACSKKDYAACKKLVGYYIEVKDMKSALDPAERVCNQKSQRNIKYQSYYCYIAADIYLVELDDSAKATRYLKASCASKDGLKHDFLRQLNSSSCVLVAAIEKNSAAFEKELKKLEPLCTDSFCQFNLAVALALLGRFDEAVTYIEKAVANGSGTEIAYFAKYPELKADKRIHNVIKVILERHKKLEALPKKQKLSKVLEKYQTGIAALLASIVMIGMLLYSRFSSSRNA